ncbi:caspase-1-like [Contarinia nasturtii]|uniref:caspase-1-like n=1 Tax=Contarinia nasturtii TaxID=265458 RepID=UPI0012D473B4|nr:caspase-1-like [Contarinia nasturtii]
MGNTLTKVCCRKSASDVNKLEEVEYTPSNGTPNGCKKPIGNKDQEKIKIDIDISSTNTELDFLDGEDEQMEELNPNHYYKMNHGRRGLALIFNHELFECNKPRNGSSADRNRLQTTLESLDFDVKIFENETVSEIRGVLQEIAEMDHSDCDCFLIAVLTHGDSVPLVGRREQYTTILTHDLVSYLHAYDNKYPLQMLWEYFTDENCPTLASKPRIFFIAACQGYDVDEGYGVPIENYRRRRPGGDIAIPFSSAKYKPFDAVHIDKKKNLPQKDFLVIFSTKLGFLSYRDTEHGTWYIQSLCKVLNEKKHELHFLQILTLVNQSVAIDYQSGEVAAKQMPCVFSMLTKLLLFPKKKSLSVAV